MSSFFYMLNNDFYFYLGPKSYALELPTPPPPPPRLPASVGCITTTPTTTIQPRTPPPSPCNTSPNESLQLVGGSLTPSASPNDPQRVITTRWGLSHPFHLPHQPQRPPTTCNVSAVSLSTLPTTSQP